MALARNKSLSLMDGSMRCDGFAGHALSLGEVIGLPLLKGCLPGFSHDHYPWRKGIANLSGPGYFKVRSENLYLPNDERTDPGFEG